MRPGSHPDFDAFSNHKRAGRSRRLAAFGIIAAAGVTLAVVSLAGLPSDVVGATTARQNTNTKPLAPVGSFKDAASGQQQASIAPSAPNLLALPIPEVTSGPAAVIKIVSVRKGDTLMKALTRAGAPRREAHEAISVLNKVFDPRRLKIGQEIRLELAALPTKDKKSDKLLAVHITTDVDREVNVQRKDKGFVSQKVVRPLSKGHERAEGTIKSSLFLSARRSGVPIGVLMEMIRIFSWDVDFQRDIQQNDTFEIFYERFRDDEDRAVKDGEVLYASMTLSGTKVRLYRHVLKDGTVDYFNEKGQSARKALLRTPVNGARLSSRFGKRRHPVLGYSKMHRGLDFAAPRGTPIMAGGDGVVEKAQRNGSYGRYIRIRHHSGFKTAYAHLKSYARGVRRGKRVKQGQIIGYIGTSGRSTGPHLHYEILKNNRQINPLSLRLPTGRKLKKKALARFEATRLQTNTLMAAIPVTEKVASSR